MSEKRQIGRWVSLSVSDKDEHIIAAFTRDLGIVRERLGPEHRLIEYEIKVTESDGVKG